MGGACWATADVVLATRSLEKRFGSVEVLRGVDMTVGAGQIYGFLGRNGAGKTTTIRSLMGIERADGGAIELFGVGVKRPGLREKRQIGR